MKPLNFSRLARLFGAFLAGLLITVYAAADHNTPEALEARIAPEGKLNVVAPGSESETASTQVVAATPKDGESVYNTTCAVCHNAGIAGAPKTGDVDVWEERIGQGMAVLVEHAIDGFQGATGVMLPKGGNAALSDDEVAAAVEYMVEQSQ